MAPMPMRVTCRYLKKDKLIHPPPLMEGEAIASRVLELGPAGAKFLGPVIIEVPHFASLRGREREIVILRSDNGETWREHTLEATEEAVQEVLQDSFDADELSQLEDLNTNRITRILTTDFPQYFAIVSRIRQEVHAIGPEGGVVNSTVVPQVQAVFPQGALTKKIKVGLQAQPIPPELTAKLLGNRVAVSPIVTVEPRRRKFHKPITLTIPVPQAAGKGMINQYNGETPTLRLLCSITGGTTRAQWEDVTGSTPLNFVSDCVNFTTTVSARFWLMDCRNVGEATKMATELYREAIHVPFMAKFLVFAKRYEILDARLRVFCMTDDKEEKTLEGQEHFTEIAKSRDVEVLEGKSHFVEFGGNLVPVTKSGDQLSLRFYAFRENRLPFNVRVKDPNSDPHGRIAFMKEPKSSKQDAPQTPICNLNLALPENITPEVLLEGVGGNMTSDIQSKVSFLREAGYGKFDTIHKADLKISDIGNLLGNDWVRCAHELEIPDSDINIIKSEYPDNDGQQAMVMLRFWLNTQGNKATGNALERALRKCDREDIINKCIVNAELVTDESEKSAAKVALEIEETLSEREPSPFDQKQQYKDEIEDEPIMEHISDPIKQEICKDKELEDEDESKHAADELITEKIAKPLDLGHYDTVEENIIEEEQEVKISSMISSHTKESSVQIYEEEEVKYVAEEKDQPEVESEPEIETEFVKEKVFDGTHLSDDLEERSEDDKPEEEKTEVDSRRSISPEVVPKSISPEVEVPEVEEKEIIMDYSREYSTQSSHTSYQKEPEMEETFEAVVTKEIEVQPVVMEEPEVEEAKPEVETEDKKESSSDSISDEDEVARPISQEIVEPSTTEPEIVVQETEIKISQMSMPPPPEILVQPSPEVEDEPEPEVDDEPSKFTEFTESTIHESATTESISKEDVLDTIATTTTESHETSNTDEANKRYSSTYSEASVEEKSEADSQELETKPEPEVKKQPETIKKTFKIIILFE